MYCTRCGVQLNEADKFCAQCGTATARASFSAPSAYSKLSRPRDDRKIAGVCAGFARYMGVDVTLIRLIAVILIFWPPGVGLIAYVVGWAVMPNDPLHFPAPAPQGAEAATGRS